jgi:hypothetical protein
MCKNAGPNYFAEPNQHVLTFLLPKSAVQCISGVALFADDFLNCMMSQQAASMLEDVEQSPPPSTIFAMKGCSDALVDPTLLGHKDKDVGVLVALCISEIMRIVAPDAPYSDDCLKVVFVFFIVAQVFILVNNKTHTLSLLQFLSHPDTKKVVVVVVVLLCRKFSS